MFVKSWKTTLLGVCAFVVGGLTYTGVITNEQGQALLSLLVTLIGLFSKDGNVTESS
jgi:hypothetical protein